MGIRNTRKKYMSRDKKVQQTKHPDIVLENKINDHSKFSFEKHPFFFAISMTINIILLFILFCYFKCVKLKILS